MPFIPFDEDIEWGLRVDLLESVSLVIVQLDDVDDGDTAPGSGNLTTGEINGGERVKELLESLSTSSCSTTVTAGSLIP